MGDLLNYYIDKSANEAFIGTASQRDSVLQIARLVNYAPTDTTAAVVTLTFSNSSDTAITVPARTQVATTTSSNATSTQIVFETDSAVTVPAKSGSTNGTITVSATQGKTVVSEKIGESSGEINQLFKLAQTPVIKGSVSVVAGSTNYTQVNYLIDYSNYDPVFSVVTAADTTSYVQFGDNVSGRVPTNKALIYATYRVGGGVSGNVSAGTLRSILTNNAAGLTVTNIAAASGGADQESTESIRLNAPNTIRAYNRAVSISDYSALAKAAGVAKANATADVYTSITLYYAPYGDSGVLSDGVTPSTVFNNYKTVLDNYLTNKIPANTTVTYQPPTYVKSDITAAITILPQYKQGLVSIAVSAVLTELFDFDNVAFEDTITLYDVQNAIKSVEGVANVTISKLVRDDADLTYTVSNKALTSNVATLTTSAAHALTIGSTVLVSGVDTTFNGTFVVTGVTSTTFTYALVSPNVTSAAVSGGKATKLTVGDIVCAVNEIPTLNTDKLELTFTGGISS